MDGHGRYGAPTVSQLPSHSDPPDAAPMSSAVSGLPGKPTRREILTDRIVCDLPAPARGAKITYDGGDPRKCVTGFGVRVTATGQRSFILNYWVRGLERRYTIGRFPEFKVSV